MANMGFAVAYTMNALCYGPKAVERIDLTYEFFNALLYVLTYREITGDGLLLVMHMMRAYSRQIPLVRSLKLIDYPTESYQAWFECSD